MVRENYRKVKLLKLLELLRQQTDEQHPMTAAQICVAMSEMGIPCDRRIVTQDIANLNKLDYKIMHTMIGHEKNAQGQLAILQAQLLREFPNGKP